MPHGHADAQLADEMLPSMGSVGDCYDNAVIESFWGRMQVEVLNRKRWRIRIELANAIFEYLEIFYNLATLPLSAEHARPERSRKSSSRLTVAWTKFQNPEPTELEFVVRRIMPLVRGTAHEAGRPGTEHDNAIDEFNNSMAPKIGMNSPNGDAKKLATDAWELNLVRGYSDEWPKDEL